MIEEQKTLEQELNRIFEIFKTSDGEIRPHFILTGESGSGKSYIINALSKEHDINTIEINAAQLTKEGTAGNSLSKALAPLSNNQNNLSICFVDEFDKLFISGNSNSTLAHETTNGVQNEFLKVLESDTASVFGDYGKYHEISVKQTLFVFAGAFNGDTEIDLDKLRQFGIKTEFLGRVGLVYSTKKLSLESLFYILENSEILTKYLKLFPAVKKITVVNSIKKYLTLHYENNTIGIRLVNTLINQYFIKGGKLSTASVKTISFQKEMKL